MSRPISSRRTPVPVALATGLAVLFGLLLFVQLYAGRQNAAGTIGVVLEEGAGGVFLPEVDPQGPADVAGLRAGDHLLLVDGLVVRSLVEYDEAAQSSEPGGTQIFSISRDGDRLDVAVTPGVPFDWTSWAFNALAAVAHLGLGLLILVQASGDVRVRLLWIVFVAIGLEFALPESLIGAPWLFVAAQCSFWVLTGLQASLELHLASVIPQPWPWFRTKRWPLALFYGFGLGFGVLMALTEIPGAEQTPALAWAWEPVGIGIADAWFVVWALGVVLLLANSALRWPEPTGRHQAWLLLLGVLPWAGLIAAQALWDQMGAPYPYPAWVGTIEPLIFTIYPVTVFLVIFKYRLFDLELVVRRSLVYATLSTTLLLAFYVTAVAIGAALSMVLEGTVPTAFVAAGASLVLGLLFSPLKQLIEQQVDQRFFPERVALRERLAAMVRDLPGQGQLSAMAETVVADVVDIFDVEGACLLLSDRESHVLIGRSSRGWSDGPLGLPLPKSDPLVEFLQKRGRASLSKHWPLTRFPAAGAGERGGELAVPIVRSGELTGILVLGSKRDGDDFAAEEIGLLNLLSHHLATVLENAHLHESATVDALTGLLRRESVLAELERELDRASRYSRPLTVAMIDIDRFKAVNDTYGHLAGDVMLHRVAAEISSQVRRSDVLGRYGGEEFLLMLPETDLDSARKVAEDLRRAVENLVIALDRETSIRVTVSIGLASLDDLSSQASPLQKALIEAADRSLYGAKRGGRNRIALPA